ncbi:hypothetical protein [Methylobacter sp.]|uniref:hypothetical protein n=1 Tax=Methylobacter sp. TaxID=2051955 RepID=UPI00121E2E34|nr:hypothetical protein [Methylobacter sp.]TAK60294.1 MAG: hypothetical protein EPO18_17935 [Methylobacter sp.]
MVNTGETVLKEDGVLPSCTKRQSLCGYACCKFSVGNWIMLLPGEYELAIQQSLKRDHLSFENNTHVVCSSPCKKGDLKPIDCSWYPLFPANQNATKFLVADHRKCPIPNKELIDKMLAVHASALAWEQQHPGSLEQMVTLSRDFVGYMPFPYKIENSSVADMTAQELQDIALPNELPANYVCKEWTVIKPGYSAALTPDDEK